uniref:Uncharacterized protein n=1 Tax=Romanomermis culicivorax TaxID=13658 RepID=A0A915HRZ7_ROMCU
MPIPARGAALSTGVVVMTNAGCEAGVDLVTGVVADIDVIVVEDGSTKAIVGNDAIVHMQFGLGSG